MENLLPIGRFSQITRLTVKALRYYDEIGLLKPAAVDEATGYRYYSLAQAIQAERIRLLRSLDVPIEDIQTILRESDPDAVRAHFARHRDLVRERADRYQSVLAALDGLMDEKGGFMEYEIRTREERAQPIISIRTRTSIANIGEDLSRAFGELFKFLGRSFRRPAGAPFCLYHDAEFKEEDIDMEVCVPTKKKLWSRGEITAEELPGGPVAYTLHVGAYENISRAYQALAGWIQEHGHETSGPARETYLVGPTQVKDRAAYQTEVAWPIAENGDMKLIQSPFEN